MPAIKNVTTFTARDNAVAVEKTINDLIAKKYSGAQWVRRGPNWIENTETGEAVNMNAEAVDLLHRGPDRKDVVISVVHDDGAIEKINIPSETVQSTAGGDVRLLRARVQAMLDDAVPKIPWLWIGIGVGAVALYWGRR